MERWRVRTISPPKPASWCCVPAAAPSTPPSPRTLPSRSWPGTAAGSAAMPSGSSGTRSAVRPSRSTAADAPAAPPPSKGRTPSATSRCPNEAPGPSPCPAQSTRGGKRIERFGRLDWTFLLAPAIDLASGFPVSGGWLEAVERSTRSSARTATGPRSIDRMTRPRRAGADRSAAGAGEDLAGALRRGPGRSLSRFDRPLVRRLLRTLVVCPSRPMTSRPTPRTGAFRSRSTTAG